MIKYGFKIWSTDKFLFEESAKLVRGGQADFIEIYIVPDSFKIGELAVLKGLETYIHAPHYGHNFNIFSLNEKEVKMFQEQVVGAADFLNSKRLIVHAGVGEDKGIFKQGLEKIFDARIIIENKPKIGLNNTLCFGYSFEQLTYIKDNCGLEICFDLQHAIKAALNQKIDYKEYLAKLIKHLKPTYYHISGATADSGLDEHLNIWEGSVDIRWIKNMLNEFSRSQNICLVFEVPKNGHNLDNDLKNIEFFKNL